VDKNYIKKILKVKGMSCPSCALKIESSLRKIRGVLSVKVAFDKSCAYITYDATKVSLDTVLEAIKELDYEVEDISDYKEINNKLKSENAGKNAQFFGVIAIILALYLIIKNTFDFNFIPQISQSMSYGILFLVGLLTSIHCIAMCGGIVISQCTLYESENEKDSFSKFAPSLMYNIGRVISYTTLGGIVGAIGSIISFSGKWKGVVTLITGILMIILGINMLNIFPRLRKFMPRMPKVFTVKIYTTNKKRPFYIGLLNGLMPCGPLQSMQLYALGTGSFSKGALSMFIFSLGTIPLMFGLGALSSILNAKFTKRMLKVSATLVVILGLIMVNRGLNLAGFNTAFGAYSSKNYSSNNIAKIQGDVQIVTAEIEPGSYPTIVVQKGIPLRWIMKARKNNLNGCNNPIVIPEYNIERKLVPGDNIIEFIPQKEGNIIYTCWMGMISGNIKVVDNINNVSLKDLNQNDAGNNQFLNGSCCR